MKKEKWSGFAIILFFNLFVSPHSSVNSSHKITHGSTGFTGLMLPFSTG